MNMEKMVTCIQIEMVLMGMLKTIILMLLIKQPSLPIIKIISHIRIMYSKNKRKNNILAFGSLI